MLAPVRPLRGAGGYLRSVVVFSLLFALYVLFGPRSATRPLESQLETSDAGSPSPPLEAPTGDQTVTSGDSNHTAQPEETRPQSPACHKLRGGEGVQIVMRTGATEIKDKLPIHLSTTFQCYYDVLIISDYEEVFQGHEVHNVLDDVGDGIKQANEEFQLYQRIQDHGRQSLQQNELSGTASFENGPIGRMDNTGWRLDKWKFLPMIKRVLKLRPDQDWYVFVEPDTYLIYSNLLEFLGTLDANQPWYLGSEVAIGDDIFTHGGSGFVISRPALERVAKHVEDNKQSYEEYTAIHWAGDCILGKALHESGTEATWAWPMFQGGNPSTMDFKEDKMDERRKLWCTPVLTYHHLSPWEIEHLWLFEQRWIDDHYPDPTSPGSSSWGFFEDHSNRLRHMDVFIEYSAPNMTSHRNDWQNWSPLIEAETEAASIDDCKAICEADHDCVQYTLDDKGCWLGYDPKLGQPFAGVQSGWIMSRVEQWEQRFGRCSAGRDWIAP
ncbi:glycosyltransferase family 31 protein [Polychaeton citri CBS 116435]|uniref:N-acetylgalactosaminide beta-1,3-galactosyltransferase n=1 Tax=Polychaeton citri CBS 116435 TaxID=1314669 RepID=A0A9P4QDU0_9PEZI|nr:glycosyltransferase family 31 protein [Polychaeton citri CBS 116435]